MKWLCVSVAIVGLLVALPVAPPLVFAASITFVDEEVGSVPLDATRVAASASGGSYCCVVPSGKGSYWMINGERAGTRSAWTPKGPKQSDSYTLLYVGDSDELICVDGAYHVERVPRSPELLVRVSLPFNLFETSRNPKVSSAIVRDHNIVTLPSSFHLYMAAAGRYVYSMVEQKTHVTGTPGPPLLLYIDGKLLAKDEHFKLGMAADDGGGWVVVTSARFGSGETVYRSGSAAQHHDLISAVMLSPDGKAMAEATLDDRDGRLTSSNGFAINDLGLQVKSVTILDVSNSGDSVLWTVGSGGENRYPAGTYLNSTKVAAKRYDAGALAPKGEAWAVWSSVYIDALVNGKSVSLCGVVRTHPVFTSDGKNALFVCQGTDGRQCVCVADTSQQIIATHERAVNPARTMYVSGKHRFTVIVHDIKTGRIIRRTIQVK